MSGILTVVTQPWAERSPAMKKLTYLMVPLGVLVFSAFFAIFLIEKSAGDQPQSPNETYIYPHRIGANVHFFTEFQEAVYVVAKPLTIGGLLMFLVGALAARRLEQRRVEEERKARLDRIAADY